MLCQNVQYFLLKNKILQRVWNWLLIVETKKKAEDVWIVSCSPLSATGQCTKPCFCQFLRNNESLPLDLTWLSHSRSDILFVPTFALALSSRGGSKIQFTPSFSIRSLASGRRLRLVTQSLGPDFLFSLGLRTAALATVLIDDTKVDCSFFSLPLFQLVLGLLNKAWLEKFRHYVF
jgi:hypothetical protein